MAYGKKIVVVEPAFLVQAGLRRLISEMPGLSLAEIFDGNENRLDDKILAKMPDIVILNPDIFNNEQLVSLINRLSNENILIVGLAGEESSPGCKAYFRYCLDPAENKYELLETMKKINRALQDDDTQTESSGLTQREKVILNRVVRGQTTQEIADELFLSVHTVNTHRKNISNKLGIKTLSGLIVYALMNKIVKMDEMV